MNKYYNLSFGKPVQYGSAIFIPKRSKRTKKNKNTSKIKG